MTAQDATAWAWGAWIVSWFMAALWRRRTARQAAFGAEIVHLLPTLLGAALLFSWNRQAGTPRPSLGFYPIPAPQVALWTTPEPAAWALFALVVAGFLFCWWARLHLGQLWSGNVTLKPGHKVVDTGPYALVRHPIYTGLITAALATAAMRGLVAAFAGAALMILGVWLKARLEERFLRAELGADAYDAYARRVGMLVPGLGRKAG